MGLSTQPSFSLSNPSLLPYSSQKRPPPPEEDPVAVICTVRENRYPLVSVTHHPWSTSPTATVRWLAAPGCRQRLTAAALKWRAFHPLCSVLLTSEAREHCSHVAVDGRAAAAVPVTAATAGETGGVSGTATTTDPHVEGCVGWRFGWKGVLGLGN